MDAPFWVDKCRWMTPTCKELGGQARLCVLVSVRVTHVCGREYAGKGSGKGRKKVLWLWHFIFKLIISLYSQVSVRYLEETPMHFVGYDLSRQFFLSLKGILSFLVDQN